MNSLTYLLAKITILTDVPLTWTKSMLYSVAYTIFLH